MGENPVRIWRIVPEQRFSGAPGRRHKEPLRGVSPASRVSGYKLVEYPALDIPDGAWIATFPQSTLQSSLSPPVRFVHPPREMSPSESDTDSPKLFLA